MKICKEQEIMDTPAQQKTTDYTFQTKIATGIIMVVSSLFPVFFVPEGIIFFAIAICLFIGVYLNRADSSFYILLSLIANWFFFYSLWEIYYDLFVYTGGDKGQTTMWWIIGFSIPILAGLIPAIIGNVCILSQKKALSSIEKSTNKTLAVATSTEITPLLNAILSAKSETVQVVLFEHPEQLNTAYAQNGNTPLHVAALNGYTEIVRLLLEQPGIDKTIKNNDGKIALDLAQEKGFAEITELLNSK